METTGDYLNETERIIMGDDKLPFGGYRPKDVRDRVEELLEIEKRASIICKKHPRNENKSLYHEKLACSYCGYNHYLKGTIIGLCQCIPLD